MYPILFRLGPLTLYSYGAMLVVALLAVIRFSTQAARRLPEELRAISPEQLVDYCSLALLGGLLGARLFYIALYWPWFVQAPQNILAIWQGGLVWYGGLFGGMCAAWLYVRAKRLDFWRVMDQFVPFLALGHAIGRIGCFLNGCCYGKPTDAWWGVTFRELSEPVLPAQLFEAAGLFALYWLLRALQQPSVLQRRGRLSGLYFVCYATLRFCLEFLRGDQSTWWMGLTLQQLISIGLFLFGIGLFGQFRLFRLFGLSVGRTDRP